MQRRSLVLLVLACSAGVGTGGVAVLIGLSVLGEHLSQMADRASANGWTERVIVRDELVAFGEVIGTSHELGFGSDQRYADAYIEGHGVDGASAYWALLGDAAADHDAFWRLVKRFEAGPDQGDEIFVVFLAEWGGGIAALPNGAGVEGTDGGGLDGSNVHGVVMLWGSDSCCEIGLWVPERSSDADVLEHWDRVPSLSGSVSCMLMTDEMLAYHAHVVGAGDGVHLRQVALVDFDPDSEPACDDGDSIRSLILDAPGTAYAQRWLAPEPTALDRARWFYRDVHWALNNPIAAARAVLR